MKKIEKRERQVAQAIATVECPGRAGAVVESGGMAAALHRP
ncbi:MAG TPA: hypothetical protein VI670_08635 [Thermoanaerobaculia bacterium]